MLFILMYFISTIETTSAHYCEYDICSPSEYCCGDNQCCKDDKTMWILMIGLLTVLVVASVSCALLYRRMEQCLRRWHLGFWSSEEMLITQTKA